MEVAGLVIGIIALVVGLLAMPTVLQMYFGRPKLTFEADEFTGTDGKILVLAIKNQKINNRLLKGIGVERDVGNVMAFFDIQEQGTNRYLIRASTGLMHCAPLRETGLRVQALPGYTVGLTVITTLNGVAGIVDGKLEHPVPISEGHYIALIVIDCGERLYKITQGFQIGKADHQTIWYQRGVTSSST